MSDLVELLRRAINDPGQFCPRERWPDTSGISDWEYETVGAWGARAAAIALAGAGLLAPPGGEAVIAAARQWRAMRSSTPTKPKPESAALIDAVDALPVEASRG